MKFSSRQVEDIIIIPQYDWWSPTGPQGSLHKFNKVRANFIRKNLMNDAMPIETQEEYFSKFRVLDIGCGAGILSESLGRLGMGSVTGIDPTDKCVELAQAHLKLDADLAKKVTYKNTTVEALIDEKFNTNNNQSPHKDELYDLVCCSEVIEHVNDQQEFLRKCAKLVKPETGYFFLSTIAKTPESYFLTILMAEYVLRLVPKGTHEWNQYINVEDIEGALSSQAFRTVAKAGAMVTNPLTMEMDEFPNWLRGNYMILSKRLI
ncbi:hexaprenyldihydroxybenzoate mitochondrial [Stylonychia lemnae]|uniref:Hexaprenyldihydroxybenzoate mitochondrial n=1 Tax=Stylonychia lemnae TaxID=5949 RepID=A0A078AUB3_STYLE|nr:hexaprenyldihydroxybenzoate mitochondrial [Stylonychia lemnae]|eukprot:CDW84433.1 hexaprenyldihydroxybenzoate mitochondrial [Stylonychia lemnae]